MNPQPAPFDGAESEAASHFPKTIAYRMGRSRRVIRVDLNEIDEQYPMPNPHGTPLARCPPPSSSVRPVARSGIAGKPLSARCWAKASRRVSVTW
jgi:hypothetical protein